MSCVLSTTSRYSVVFFTFKKLEPDEFLLSFLKKIIKKHI